MSEILPGYDFDVREIPIAQNLLKQATALQISEIGIDELDASIVGLGSGEVSNTTDSLQVGDTVGSMWMSPVGDLWVQEQSGPVMLHRIMGGFETRRFRLQPHSSAPTYNKPGSLVNFGGVATNPVHEDFFRVEGDNPNHSGTAFLRNPASGGYEDNKGTMMSGSIQETAASNFGRMVWRGVSMSRDRDFGTSSFFDLVEMQNSFFMKSPQGATGEATMEGNKFDIDLPAWKHYGWIGMPAVGASKVSQGSGNHDWRVESMLWIFGQMMHTNRPS